MTPPGPGRRGRVGDQAASALLGTLLGAGLFSIAFATIMIGTNEDLAESAVAIDEVRSAADSERLAEDIFGSSGVGWYAAPCPAVPAPSHFTPELVQRFGLARESCDGRVSGTLTLSNAKLQNIRGASILDNPTNGRVDYAQAKASLNLDQHDFHLRGRVAMPSVDSILASGYLDRHMRPLYIGDYQKVGAQWVPEPSVLPEVRFVEALVANFQPRVHSPLYHSATIPFALGGDVVPDDKPAVQAHLPAVLTPGNVPTTSVYNVIIVGSNLESIEMNSGPTKKAIEDWVNVAGGTLIVFGSDETPYTWLEPMFHTRQVPSTGAPLVDDPTHAVLTTPNTLLVEDYVDHLKAWSFNGPGVGRYDVVASHGDATIAVSDETLFGPGRVLLTSFRPFDALGQGPTGPCDPDQIAADCEGLRLVHNLLTMRYDQVNFDYGPPIPTTGSVSAARRVATVEVPAIGPVELTVWAHAW